MQKHIDEWIKKYVERQKSSHHIKPLNYRSAPEKEINAYQYPDIDGAHMYVVDNEKPLRDNNPVYFIGSVTFNSIISIQTKAKKLPLPLLSAMETDGSFFYYHDELEHLEKELQVISSHGNLDEGDTHLIHVLGKAITIAKENSHYFLYILGD